MDLEFPDMVGESFILSAWGPLRAAGLSQALLIPGLPGTTMPINREEPRPVRWEAWRLRLVS